jgi:hypothetical protein
LRFFPTLIRRSIFLHTRTPIESAASAKRQAGIIPRQFVPNAIKTLNLKSIQISETLLFFIKIMLYYAEHEIIRTFGEVDIWRKF